MTGINLLLVLILTTIIPANQTIHRLPYKLDGDINSFEGGYAINFEFTFIDSSALTSTLEIETEQWVHDCCLQITTKPTFRIYLKQNYIYYPKVTAYLHLRKPLSSIVLTEAASLVMQNIMRTDILSLELSETSRAQVKVEIISRLDVSMSGAAKMIINGFVKGDAYINVRQAAKLDAQSCTINNVFGTVSGVGVAYINAGSVRGLTLITPHQEHGINR